MTHTIRNRATTDKWKPVLPMGEGWWVRLGELHRVLSSIFEHPWSLKVTGWAGGRPSIEVSVLAPNGDAFMYDKAFKGATEMFMPDGYYFDGTSVDTCTADGTSRMRDYYLYPEVVADTEAIQ